MKTLKTFIAISCVTLTTFGVFGQDKRLYDGRGGFPIEVRNGSNISVKVQLAHPDSPPGNIYRTWTIAPKSTQFLSIDGKRINIGSDWGVRAFAENVNPKPFSVISKVCDRDWDGGSVNVAEGTGSTKGVLGWRLGVRADGSFSRYSDRVW